MKREGIVGGIQGQVIQESTGACTEKDYTVNWGRKINDDASSLLGSVLMYVHLHMGTPGHQRGLEPTGRT